MTDTISPGERSHVMAKVHSRNTSPEMKVRRALHAAGFRYRLHVKALSGKPDIVLPRHRAVVLVQGCFWHGHHCRRFRMPASNVEYWSRKIARNEARDRANQARLSVAGWRVFIVWECQLEQGIQAVLQALPAPWAAA